MLASSGGSKKQPKLDYTSGDDNVANVGSMGGSSFGKAASFAEDYGHYSSFRVGHRDSHTLPNFAMELVCHDQMPFLSWRD